jgi:hypothetical protein
MSRDPDRPPQPEAPPKPLDWLWAELDALLGPEQTASLKEGYQVRLREDARRRRLDAMRRELPFLESQRAAAVQRYGQDSTAARELQKRSTTVGN